jgi:tRNA dimethylallyltransferase
MSDVLVIFGPTASGKSALAFEAACQLNAEIISCDSVLVHRGFDIGSAKPPLSERERVPHHLIDVVAADEPWDTGLWAKAARDALHDVAARGRLPIVVGGTGLYLRALMAENFHGDLPHSSEIRARLETMTSAELWQRLQSADAVRAAEIHPHDRYRLIRALELLELLGRPLRDVPQPTQKSEFVWRTVYLDPPRAWLHERIKKRTEAMLAAGLVAEVEDLLSQGVPESIKPMQSIGYRQVVDFLQGRLPRETLADAITAATRQYAKRQCTWFRKLKPDIHVKVLPPAPEITEQVLSLVRLE